ncbi:MAG TPA: DNA alkylation repair protein [Ktedonobacterales bacterium]|nr:DNA alkylation repair protein [Ktedonobacterales bacterium]
MEQSDAGLIAALRAELARVADPAKAPAMRAYMKSETPYLGVPTPPLRAVCREVFAAYPLATFDAWRDTALRLWRDANFREERYAAIALTGDQRYREHQRLDALPIYEEMIVSGAWWDYVDELATHRVGPLLARFPTPMRETMLAWSRDTNLWKRRAAIICQTTFKDVTDEVLLFACIEPNMGDRDFFMRKAIGWALREYAKARPDAVRDFVSRHEASLSPLSRREATRRLTKPNPAP